MPIQNNQTKQTLANMSWARLTWRERIMELTKQDRITCPNPETREFNTLCVCYYIPGKDMYFPVQTLSQMEVVLPTLFQHIQQKQVLDEYNVKQQTNILCTPTDR